MSSVIDIVRKKHHFGRYKIVKNLVIGHGKKLLDIGCGSGRVLIMLAEKYPNSNFVGHDFFEPVIERAIANAEAAGVEDRIEFVVGDAIQGLAKDYDIIMTFEVLHDAAQPVKLLQAIRQKLRDRGRVFWDEND